LNLVIATDFPIAWMLNGVRPYHVQIDVCNAACQMAVGLHSRCVISIFPESTVTILSGVELLGGSTCNQLQGTRYFPLASICAKQVNVIGCHYVVQDR